jgi:hypothetical protein
VVGIEIIGFCGIQICVFGIAISPYLDFFEELPSLFSSTSLP